MSGAERGEIVGLEGRYCADCVKTLRQYALAIALAIMCKEDLSQILSNGDMVRIAKMAQGFGRALDGGNLNGVDYFEEIK